MYEYDFNFCQKKTFFKEFFSMQLHVFKKKVEIKLNKKNFEMDQY